jgi:hypothetical protein
MIHQFSAFEKETERNLKFKQLHLENLKQIHAECLQAAGPLKPKYHNKPTSAKQFIMSVLKGLLLFLILLFILTLMSGNRVRKHPS